MAISILSLSRRHVLGDLYERCDAITAAIPVYLAGGDEPVLLGHADESMGHYADAFSFHLDTDSCKKLSAGQYTYVLGCDHADPKAKGSRARLRLTSITLKGREGYAKPIGKQRSADVAPPEVAVETVKA
ncbi:MAG TPA: hypothetical protein VMZ26_12515 [Pyrinomonadaceae bacterium]|nr:hypothetical protein [Pyrinomonadaceae bacterium]